MKRSFIEVPVASHFPIQNLPYGIFSKQDGKKRVGVAIGEYVLDLSALQEEGILEGSYFQSDSLNAFIATGRSEWRKVRAVLQELLDENSTQLRDNQKLRDSVIVPQKNVSMHLPVSIGDYTDFYSSKEHATNVGTMFRDPKNALLPNWVHIPVAYHGRASSVVVSGTSVRRPCGQTKADEAELPSFGPCRLMDFELEMGCIVGKENSLGEPVPVEQAHEHVFGMVLVNDWSARDIQKWEYVPLGPFLAKNLATSISPWVVTLEALEECRVAGPKQDPEPLPYLKQNGEWAFDIELEVKLKTERMGEYSSIAKSNFKYMYWSICQQLAHHTSNGCNLRVGDLLASGTISGPTPETYGSLLELTWRGTKPIQLSSGEERKFLQDGDSLLLTGSSVRDGYTIGFGEVEGTILPPLIDEKLLVER